MGTCLPDEQQKLWSFLQVIWFPDMSGSFLTDIL